MCHVWASLANWLNQNWFIGHNKTLIGANFVNLAQKNGNLTLHEGASGMDIE